MWMLMATRGGDGWLWLALGLAVALYGGPERLHALLAATLAVAAGIILFITLKHAFRRERPCGLEPHCWAELLPPDQFSFPSGHSITAFAVAVSLGGFYPELLPALLFCAISIAASRVVLGMHFLSDVLAGAAFALGVLATTLVP
jgi:undecaprenyl-diphosphatase